MRKTARRRFFRLALAVSACAAMLASGSAEAAPLVTVRVGSSSAAAFNFLPLPIGIKAGIYKRHGLDVQELDLEGSAKLHQAMAAGALDFGLGAGTDLPFEIKGTPEQVVGAICIKPALLGLVGPWNGVRDVSQLKGKRIGISTVGSLTQWLALQLAKKEGWKPSDFTFITVGSTTPPQVAAIVTGEVDASMGAVAMGWQLEEQKRGRLIAPASAWVGDFLQNVIYASDDMVTKHPDTVRAFLAGWYDTVDFMVKNKAKTVQYEDEIDGFSNAVNEKQYDVVLPSQSRDGTYPPKAVAAVEDSFVDLHLLPAKPDMSKYLLTQFLPGHK